MLSLNRCCQFSLFQIALFLGALACVSPPEHLAAQVECVVLNQQNWDQYVPQGKEVDAIYGDIFLRNKKIVAVIGNPVRTRHANMTVKNVGGCIIDLTSRLDPNDQLSCFYPGGDQVVYRGGMESVKLRKWRSTPTDGLSKDSGGLDPWMDAVIPCNSNEAIEVVIEGRTLKGNLPFSVTYQLSAGDQHISVVSRMTNTSDSEVEFAMPDIIRADRTFTSRVTADRQMICYYDQWFHQAYGIRAAGGGLSEIVYKGKPAARKQLWTYKDRDSNVQKIPAGESLSWDRQIIPAKDWWQLEVVSDQLLEDYRQANKAHSNSPPRFTTSITIRDEVEAVTDAKVSIAKSGKQQIAFVRTDKTGKLNVPLEEGDYEVTVSADGRESVVKAFSVAEPQNETIPTLNIPMAKLGVVSATITDEDGDPIACKVSFDGIEGTKSPNFGPDSRAIAMHNVRYSADGIFEQPIGPGKYEAIISHGTEFDAVVVKIEVVRGKPTQLLAKLKHSVDTAGWVSTEYHSHSSESGDNTSDQLGRVLNLLAEQIEFAPCTEHNRIDSYSPHLEMLNAVDKMATCSGIELTGQPLPINHQNAFPMIMRPRTQDGGGPTTTGNPVVQIERLKYWDNKSEKLVQMNHPNLVSVYADQDANNEADAGFTKMFDYVDVVEVHPLNSIVNEVTELPPPGKRGNTIFLWMQLLNQGYQIPGVINADAHYNFHGSGYYRNYVRSSTDDPAKIDTMEMVRNSKAGKIVMSSGPYLSVTAHGKGLADGSNVSGEIGDHLALDKDSVTLKVKVQCPNWIDVDRVQVFVNGRSVEALNFTRRNSEGMFKNGTVKFEQTIEVPLKEDSHLIVMTTGAPGSALGRVFGPDQGKKTPIAVSNPIFVDVNRGGFKANQDRLGAPFLQPVR